MRQTHWPDVVPGVKAKIPQLEKIFPKEGLIFIVFVRYFLERLEREVRQAICDGINADTAVYAGPIELVCGNTKGKQTMFRPDGRPALGVTNNMGGLAGKKLKPLNLENTAFFRTNLRTRHTIVGSGGVTCADDIFDYLVAGANKVQSTGFVAHYGLRALGPIFQNLADLAEAA